MPATSRQQAGGEVERRARRFLGRAPAERSNARKDTTQPHHVQARGEKTTTHNDGGRLRPSTRQPLLGGVGGRGRRPPAPFRGRRRRGGGQCGGTPRGSAATDGGQCGGTPRGRVVTRPIYAGCNVAKAAAERGRAKSSSEAAAERGRPSPLPFVVYRVKKDIPSLTLLIHLAKLCQLSLFRR